MIDISLLNIIGVAIVGNMVAHWFLPIQGVKDKFIGSFAHLPFLQSLLMTFNCSKCTSFWLSLVFFHDLLAAALASLLGLIINFIIDYIQDWYESE